MTKKMYYPVSSWRKFVYNKKIVSEAQRFEQIGKDVDQMSLSTSLNIKLE